MIRPSKYKKKPRKAMTSAPWRTPKIRLAGKDMAKLRWAVFNRSEGRCENSFNNPFDQSVRCTAKIGWSWFDLHHIIHRSRGGSDTEENTMALCVECHDNHHRHGIKAERWDV